MSELPWLMRDETIRAIRDEFDKEQTIMSLTWGQLKQRLNEEVQDSDQIGVIEYVGEPFVEFTINPRTREVEIYGTRASRESR